MMSAPSDQKWPNESAWDGLRSELGERVITVQSPFAACESDRTGDDCQASIQLAYNPFANSADAGAVQFAGFHRAWVPEMSPLAVAAESAADISTAIRFAASHGVPLSVKGTGHDFLGRSCSADSLLIWTHRLQELQMHDSFVPAGAPAGAAGIPAMSMGAGLRWLNAYKAATAANRYVQGGGATSVGAAGGFIQGGGYGTFSKKFGIASAAIIEAEVVVASGEILIANEYQNADLYWALKGGGGGTFGVVSRLTIMTFEMPKTYGSLRLTIDAESDDAYTELVSRYLPFYLEHLNGPQYSITASLTADRQLWMLIYYLDVSDSEVQSLLAPFVDWVQADRRFAVTSATAASGPFEYHWDPVWLNEKIPGRAIFDPDPDRADYWWFSNEESLVGYYVHSMQSRYIPVDFFEKDNAFTTAEMLVRAAAEMPVGYPLRLVSWKGLLGCDEQTAARNRATSTTPSALTAPVLALMGAGSLDTRPGLSGAEPGALADIEADALRRAIDVIREATPGAGSYVNEVDYFEPDWQESFWGSNYARLLEIKQKYDPHNLFRVHHGVGSEL